MRDGQSIEPAPLGAASVGPSELSRTVAVHSPNYPLQGNARAIRREQGLSPIVLCERVAEAG